MTTPTRKAHRYGLALLLMLLVVAAVFGLRQQAAAAPANCKGRAFYIDYVNGSDANNGASVTSPWKRAPGMVGFAGSYNHQPHDCYLLKGGVTWPRTVLPWVLPGSGDATANDYIGADQSFYSGGSWSQPVIDAGNANISASKNEMIDVSGLDYVTIDNLKLDHFAAINYSGSYGTCEIINAYGVTHGVFDHLTGSNQNVDFASDDNQPCSSIFASTNAPYAGNSVVQNSTFYGASTTTSSAGGAILCFGNVKNVTMHDLTGMLYPCGHGEIGNNLLYNCGYPNFPAGANLVHADAIQSDIADGAFYFHDNVIHDTGVDDAHGNECESMLIGNPGETDYVWNNVLYNLHGNSPALTQNALPGVAAYFWNNTIAGGREHNEYCLREGHSGTYSRVEFRNNHCISEALASVDPAITASTQVVDHNLLQTTAEATADGYTATQTYAYAPINTASPTAASQNAGVNLSGMCTGNLAGLCVDSTYGGLRTTYSRPPGTTAWDIGAYQVKAETAAPGADLNQDGTVDILDVCILVGQWGRTDRATADLNQDGFVNDTDMNQLISSWKAKF